MGIEYMLVRDDTREIYMLGKHTYDWKTAIAGSGPGHANDERYGQLTIDEDVGKIADRLRKTCGYVTCDDGDYLAGVAADIVRWAGRSIVRFVDDCSFDGWYDPAKGEEDGYDQGTVTGSRYLEDHEDGDIARPLRGCPTTNLPRTAHRG